MLTLLCSAMRRAVHMRLMAHQGVAALSTWRWVAAAAAAVGRHFQAWMRQPVRRCL
jgi:hypothetical protein